MALLGDIILGFKVKSDQLNQGLGKASGYLGKFSKSLGTVKGAVAAVGAALAVGAIVNGVKSMVTNSLDLIDNQAELASQLGTTQAKIAELGHVAQFTGSDAETLNGALAKMNLTLSEANATGKGGAADALNQLGLSANKLINLDPAERFRIIAESLGKIKNPADQAAMASDLFGKSAVSLLNTINAGPEEFARLSKEARELGLTLSDIDNQKIGAAKDSLDLISVTLTGLGNKMAVELSPYIKVLSDRFVAFAKTGFDAGSAVSQSIDFITGSLETTVDLIAVGYAAFKTFSAFWRSACGLIVRAISAPIEAFEYLLSLIGLGNMKIGEFGRHMADALHEMGNADLDAAGKTIMSDLPSEHVKKFSESLKSNAESAAASMQSLNTVNKKAAEDAAKALAEQQKIQQSGVDYNKTLQTQIDTFGKTTREVERYKLALNGVSKEALANAEALDHQLTALEAQKKAMDDLKTAATGVIDGLKSPLDKIAESVLKLNELFEKGLLSEEQYVAAYQAAEKAFAKAQKEMVKQQEEDSGLDDLKTKADKIKEALKTPLDKYQEDIKELRTLFDKGLLNKDQVIKAAQSANKTYEDAKNKGMDQTTFSEYDNAIKKLQSDFAAGLINKEQFNTKAADAKSKAQDQSALAEYRDAIKKLQTDFAAGLINKEQFTTKAADAKKRFDEGGKIEGDHKVGAITLGSGEARSAILAHRFGKDASELKQVAANGKDQVEQQKKTNEHLSKQKPVKIVTPKW